MSPKKVLIIDDETDFCLLMTTYFKKRNYEVHISHTLKDGMSLLENVQPDIVFLDNNLPDGLGWEQTEFIVEHYPAVHLNLISAYQYNPRFPQQFKTIRVWEKPISLTDLNHYTN